MSGAKGGRSAGAHRPAAAPRLVRVDAALRRWAKRPDVPCPPRTRATLLGLRALLVEEVGRPGRTCERRAGATRGGALCPRGPGD